MLSVSHDPAVVESNLLVGRVACPDCGGRLRPWGWARPRVVRVGLDTKWSGRSLRPRRSRCTICQVTHVLLEVRLAVRRADTAEVIAAAIEAKTVLGVGHRTIAASCGRPPSTVRGWLRAFATSAVVVGEGLTALLVRDAPDAVGLWPNRDRNDERAAFLRELVGWHAQHQPALTPGAVGGKGGRSACPIPVIGVFTL